MYFRLRCLFSTGLCQAEDLYSACCLFYMDLTRCSHSLVPGLVLIPDISGDSDSMFTEATDPTACYNCRRNTGVCEVARTPT